MTMIIEMTDLFDATVQMVADIKLKHNLTGDLLPRMVLDLNVKLAKVAELAGLGEWHRTEEQKTNETLGVILFDYLEIQGGQKEWPTRNPLLEAYADAQVAIISIASEAGYAAENCCTWDESLEGSTAHCFDEMFLFLNYFLFCTDKSIQLQRFRMMNYIFINLGNKEFGFDWDEHIAPATMEAINRKRTGDGEVIKQD